MKIHYFDLHSGELLFVGHGDIGVVPPVGSTVMSDFILDEGKPLHLKVVGSSYSYNSQHILHLISVIVEKTPRKR
jgi:hypothetical protein